jgi:hypothetical protein
MKRLLVVFCLLGYGAFAADLVMDNQVADIAPCTNFVLKAATPASSYFVVKRIVAKCTTEAVPDTLTVTLVTEGDVEYAVDVTLATNSASQVTYTPTVPIEVHGYDSLAVLGVTTNDFRVSYDAVSRTPPKGTGLVVE